MEKKHSIIVITYNQENLIGRALDSLLCQKEFIYEIIVSDDCSTDDNWGVINKYKQKYPEIIKPFRNPVNLGIFGNIESTWNKVSGNVIWHLAGDDIFCNGLFQEADRIIEENNIDTENELFTIYFDFKVITPSGKEIIHRNNLVKKYNPVSLKIRQLISNRTTCYSRKVLANFYPVRKDIGIQADGLQDIQVQLFTKKSYYSPMVGSAYYSGIGISSRTKQESNLRSYILSLEQLKADIKNLSKKDEYWLNYIQHQVAFKLNPSLKNYMQYVKYFMKIIVKYYGWVLIKREAYRIIKDSVKLLVIKPEDPAMSEISVSSVISSSQFTVNFSDRQESYI